MLKYILKRLLLIIPTLLGVLFIVFTIMIILQMPTLHFRV